MCFFQPLSGIWPHGIWHSRNFPLGHLWLPVSVFLLVFCSLLVFFFLKQIYTVIFPLLPLVFVVWSAQVPPDSLTNYTPCANFYCHLQWYSSQALHLPKPELVIWLIQTCFPHVLCLGKCWLTSPPWMPHSKPGHHPRCFPYSSHSIIPPNSSSLVPLRSFSFMHCYYPYFKSLSSLSWSIHLSIHLTLQ